MTTDNSQRIVDLVDAISAKIKADAVAHAQSLADTQAQVAAQNEIIGELKVALTDVTTQLENAEKTIEAFTATDIGDLASHFTSAFNPVVETVVLAAVAAAVAPVAMPVTPPANAFGMTGGNASA
jgi:flagellar hook-basal body complex protein FliE